MRVVCWRRYSIARNAVLLGTARRLGRPLARNVRRDLTRNIIYAMCRVDWAHTWWRDGCFWFSSR